MKLIARAIALIGLTVSAPVSAKSNIDTSLNLWGEDYPAATSAFTSELRYVGGLGCFKRTTPGTDHKLNTEQETFLDNTVQDFVWEPCAYIANSEDNTDPDFGTLLIENVADYHAARPSGKFIAHVEITEFADVLPDSHIIYNTATEYYRDMFVYREGCNGTGVPGYPECVFPTDLAKNINDAYIMDINNINYRNFMADALAREMADHGIDGIVVDNVHPTPNDYTDIDYKKPPFYGTIRACDWIRTVIDRNYAAGSCNYNTTSIPWSPGANSWDTSWVSFFTALQAEIATTSRPSMTVYASPVKDDYAFSNSLLPQVDGYVQEDFAGTVAGAPLPSTVLCPGDEPSPYGAPLAVLPHGFYCTMRDMKQLMAAADTAAKPIIFTAETKIDAGSAWCGGPVPATAPWDTLGTTANACSLDGNLNPTTALLQHNYMRYYTAAFLIANDGNIRFKFDHPTVTGDQYNAMPYYYQWRCNIGTPDNGPLLMTKGTFDDGTTDQNNTNAADDDSYIFLRSYSGGKVWLNTTDAAYAAGPVGVVLYDTADVSYPADQTINVPAHSGLILYNSLSRCP